MKLKLLFLLFLICGFAQAQKPIVQWAKSFGGTKDDYSTTTLGDNRGNYYLIGHFESPSIIFGNFILTNNSVGQPHIYIVKYDSVGTVLWAKSTGNSDFGYVPSASVDNLGNLYVCGYFKSSSVTFGTYRFNNPGVGSYSKLFIVKYDASGNVQWAKSSENLSSTISNTMTSVCTDSSGNVYATGIFGDNVFSFGSVTLNHSSSIYCDIYLLKLDSLGNSIWGKNIYGDYYIEGKSVAIDLKGNVFIAGNFSGKAINFGTTVLKNQVSSNLYQYLLPDIFIAKYDSSGELLWAKSAGSDGNDNINSMAVDNKGSIYVGGSFSYIQYDAPTIGNNYMTFDNYKLIANSRGGNQFLAKYDDYGNIKWTKTTTSPINFNVQNTVQSICIDKENNLYSTGVFSFPTKFDNVVLNETSGYARTFICKYDSLGHLFWAKSFGDTTSVYSQSIFIDKNTNIYLTGYFTGYNAVFDSITLINKYKGFFLADIFLTKISTNGTLPPKYITFCEDDSILTIIAPSNSKFYTWIDVNNKVISNYQTLTVTNSVDSAVYTCKFKDAMDSTYIVKYILVKSIPKANFSSSLSDCKTNAVQFTNLSTTNQGSLNYQWDFGDGTTSTVENPVHNYTTIGNHTVSLLVTNKESGCTNSTSKVITYYPKPTISISGDTTLCNNETVLKAHGADAYVWSDGSTTDSIKVSTGQKIWVLGYSASGCVSDTTFQIVQDLSPRPGVSGSFKFCPGNSTVLHARGAYRYEWSDGTIADTMVVSKDTTIWMIAYSVAGCYTDTIKLHIKQLPGNNLNVEGNLNFCEGESTTLTASGAKYYRWNTGETKEKITVDKPGIYTVTGRNETYCSNTLSVNVQENPLPLVDFSLSNYIIDSRNNSVTGTAKGDSDVSYFWDLGDGTNETGNTIQHNYNINNSQNEYNITLTGTNPKGCSNTKTIKLNVEIFIPNIFSPNGDGINDIFMPGLDLEVFNRNGMTLYKGLSGWDGNYNGKEMPDDTYFYVINYKDNKGKVQTRKGYIILKR